MSNRVFVIALASSAFFGSSAAQEPDTAFRARILRPAYGPGSGPLVCIDAAHANHHTASGRYAPFARLLRDDGYRIAELLEAWSDSGLAECAMLVVANALAESNTQDRSPPYPSALARAEIQAVAAWIQAGGGLLLVADHSPWAGAAGDLGLIFGFHMLNAYAVPSDSGAGVAVFG